MVTEAVLADRRAASRRLVEVLAASGSYADRGPSGLHRSNPLVSLAAPDVLRSRAIG